ncbi:hypothetical protein NDA11_004434 [Ustilago hordei]|nr:hypothetical protein NDA10_005008 [Ustilago hordei]KAJ1583306.1 hypothetical protein NDA15_002368 [Ustilago hordei]KAJ1586702.1 hypothetical protein NDA11_004434 [Ustilago hordei]KAJ1591750.1 hypothetical protein NDA12_002685 [Ustilago hordei]KAJ1603499.1 hypothetical protein NDA14_007223 [Ustilago hordei]
MSLVDFTHHTTVRAALSQRFFILVLQSYLHPHPTNNVSTVRSNNMLTATETRTWSAPLVKAARRFIDAKTEVAGGGLNDDTEKWQFVAGHHWWCKVISTQPSTKQWPATMDAGGQSSGHIQMLQAAMDRQLSIIIESGSAESEHARLTRPQNGFTAYSQPLQPSDPTETFERSNSSQPWAPMVLADVDLVRINKAYFRTNRRLDAVKVYQHNLRVGVWYLDEYDPTKSYSIQLVFKKEKDKQHFLKLIEPDVSMQTCQTGTVDENVEAVNEKKIDKKPTAPNEPTEAKANDESSRLAALEAALYQSQSLADTLLQMAKTRIDSQKTEQACSTHTPPDNDRRLSSEQPSTAGYPNCAHSIRPNFGSNDSFSSRPDSSYDALFSSDVVRSMLAEREDTPVTNVSAEESQQEEEHEDPGLWGWPNHRAVECIQDDVCRLCLADPNLEWIIARCVDEHFRDQSVDYPEYG